MIEITDSGACAGCAIGDVCALVLPAAAADYLGGCDARPQGEVVLKINANTVSYVDPPTTSAYRTIGRVAYFPADDFAEALITRCRLPDSEEAICNALESGLVSDDPAASPQPS